MHDIKPYLQQLSRRALISTIEALQQRHHVGTDDLKTIVKQVQPLALPSYIFVKGLSSLESICKYLKEEQKLTYHHIALLLKRDDRTIWTTYKHACVKRKKPFTVTASAFSIPVALFADRTLSVLETLVRYLKEEYAFTYHEIGLLLQRNERTIWTVYQRAKKKL